MNNIHIRSAMKRTTKKLYSSYFAALSRLQLGGRHTYRRGHFSVFRVMTDWLNKTAVVLYDAVCADLWLLPLFFSCACGACVFAFCYPEMGALRQRRRYSHGDGDFARHCYLQMASHVLSES